MDRQALIAAMEVVAAEKPRSITVKGWGTIFVRSLTTAEVEESQADAADDKDKRTLARGAARLICDENGVRLFDHANKKDVDLLASQPWSMLRRVLAAGDVKEDTEGN